jgi:hypothetical protein
MKLLGVFPFVLVAIAACSGGQSQPDTPASGTAPPGAQLQGAGQGPASPEVDRKSPDCKYVIASGRCFVIQSAACAAAGCDLTNCISAESFPAQVSCKK